MTRTNTARRMVLAASIGAILLAGGTAAVPAGAAAAAARNPCGLYRDNDQAMYKNCSQANENLFVTRIVSSNTYHCVTPGSVAHLGSWNNVFRVYHRGTC